MSSSSVTPQDDDNDTASSFGENVASQAAAAVSTSNHVYIQDEDSAWIPARVLNSDSDQQTCRVSVPVYKNEQAIQSDGGKTCLKFEEKQINLTGYDHGALPLQNVDTHGNLQVVEDMVDLPFLHEAAILYNLKARHVLQLPYTRTGDIVIAVNPYQWMHDLYSLEQRQTYAQALVWNTDHEGDARTTVEPHVYETSSLSYRGLAVEGQNQSILVSGESGAGKTETVKILMSHLASVQAGCIHPQEDEASGSAHGSGTSVSPIVQRVLDSNPLLEAFGNAKTVRNDNSSRFGKYIQLQFHAEDPTLAAFAGKAIPSCLLAGSKCEVYLLEKSRVVGHEEEDERTYHIFYQLLAAPEETKRDIWEGLADTDQESFTYVGWSDTETIEGKTDAERFELTKQALQLVGIEGDTLRMLFRAICVVLQLGNFTFEAPADNDEGAEVSSKEELTNLASLLGVPEDVVSKSLTLRTVRARNEEYKVPLNTTKAKDSCDAFAKEIYAKTFLWLVRTINDATCAEKNYDSGGEPVHEFGLIGLLDIFGFESFETNRFEQLCINYANEKLQQKFTQDIFRSVQAEYEFEGIALGEITYADNVDVLTLIEGRMGFISVLNEECVRPKGNDVAFVSKVQTMNKDSDCLIVEKSFRNYQFGVKHYAGPVIYDATNFVTKNTDTLPPDLLECARQSSNEIVSKHLSNDSMMNVDEAKSKSRKKANKARPPIQRRTSGALMAETVWTKFRNQLTSLMSSLSETRTRYIRCIKPNTEKQPLTMQHSSTVEQLRCAGVVAAVTISRSAFPNRLEHEVVLDRFKSLWTKGNHRTSDENADLNGPQEGVKKDVDHLLTSALKCLETEKDGGLVKAFVIGKTRAYFRAGALEHLESERLKGLGVWAVEIERIVRGFVKRSQFVKKRNAAIKAVAKMRGFVARKKYLRLRKACVFLQCWVRCIKAGVELISLRKNHKATQIQAHFRMVVALASFKKHRNAAVLIQAIARGSIQRPKFREELAEKIEEAKLENQLKSLQRKLEEAEARRIEAEQKAAAPVVVYREATTEEKKAEAGADGDDKPPAEVTTAPIDSASTSAAARSGGQLTSQQQTLMDESGKMLEYLRKEVFKLRSQNAQLRTDFDLLKENNQRLMDANASAGASFAALNQHAKQLNKTNAKLVNDVHTYKQQVHKLNINQVELREELKMKQATYIAEVHSRLQYQKTMEKMVNEIQERCRDSRLVEDILTMSDDCEADYMSGPTGRDAGPVRSLFSSPSPLKTPGTVDSEASLVGRFKSFFS